MPDKNEKVLISLVIKQMQIKTVMDDHSHPQTSQT